VTTPAQPVFTIDPPQFTIEPPSKPAPGQVTLDPRTLTPIKQRVTLDPRTLKPIGAQPDWFEQNAPRTQGTDWFEQNAPRAGSGQYSADDVQSTGRYSAADVASPDMRTPVTFKRYIAPGQGSQDFQAGSTDEQQFLQRFPTARVVLQYKTLPVTSETETPEERTATQTADAKRNVAASGMAAGALIAPGLAPEAGLWLSSGLAAGGAGFGTAAGQAVMGDNPLEKQNIEQGGINAAVTGGLSLITGAPFSLASRIIRGLGLGNGEGAAYTFRVPADKIDALPPQAAFQPALANTPREIIQHAADNGVDLTTFEATKNPIAGTLQAGGERSALAPALEDARITSRLQLARTVTRLADQLDPQGMGFSEEQAGETLQQAVKVGQNISHENASYAYKDLPPEFGNATVNVSAINSKNFQQLQQATTSLANRNPSVAAQIRDTLTQMSNLGTPSQTASGAPYMAPEMKVSDLLKLRSDAIADGNSLARAGAPSEVQAIYRQLAKDADSSVQSVADKMGLTDQWRSANAGWRDYQTKYNDSSSPLYRILNQSDPALVTRSIMNRGSARDIELLNEENIPTDALKRQVVNDLAKKGFPVSADGLGGYSHSFLRTLFGDDATKELYLDGELSRRMGFQLNPSGTSNVILGMDQLKPGIGMARGVAAAKASMPQPAANFLPRPTVSGLPATVAESPTAALMRASGLTYNQQTGRMERLAQ
jgi:hypothetical protein